MTPRQVRLDVPEIEGGGLYRVTNRDTKEVWECRNLVPLLRVACGWLDQGQGLVLEVKP